MHKQGPARTEELVSRIRGLDSGKRRLLFTRLQQMGVDVARLPIVPAVEGSATPLSYAQQRQWFLWQLEPEGCAYNIPAALRLRGALDIQALSNSLKWLSQQQASLRTRLDETDGEVHQRFDEDGVAVLEFEDCTLPLAERDDKVNACLGAELAMPFDLTAGPLWRVRLVRLGDDDHLLLLSLHHLITDGWSMNVLVEQLLGGYSAFANNAKPELVAPCIQYGDYASWQREWMESGERERQLAWWTTALGRELPVLELPTDHPRPPRQSYRGARLEVALPGKLSEALRQLAQARDVTPFMLLLASFQVLLHRYSGHDDIRVGVPNANRNRLETESLIGLFVNTQIMRAQITQGLRFDEFLEQVREMALGAQAHQDLPFEQLVEALQPERSLAINPLFQVMYNHQHANADRVGQQLPGLQAEALRLDNRTAQLDLALETYDLRDGFSAVLIYATDLFEANRIERLASHWLNLLHSIVDNPHGRIDQLPMLDTDERQQALLGWNATATEYPLDTPVQRLIEAQVQRTPQAEALVFGDVRLSYAELDARANQLAHHLVGQGVGPDVLVGIAAERSIEMVVGLLAVLKAGGAYVPLDPELPAERLAYMFEDSGIGLLLTQSHLSLPMPAGLKLLALDQLDLSTYPTTNPNITVAPENLAYVIYTSGSTGKPKGAGNRHSALTNRLCWMQQAYGLDNSDTVLQKTPFSFDVSVWEFFWPLMTGARLAVAGPGDHRDPARLVELIQQYQVTTLHFVPSMLQAFLTDAGVSNCTGLKRIVCSGEALPVDAQQQVFAKLPQAGLYNLYGPTEAAIDVTHWTCREEGADTVPIGQPIANLATYVLDSELNPVPTGVIGELYLGGEGLARGYHRRPGLTAERFATSPFGRGERLYRTGDLARQRADGVIEYAGRIDHQVKIRGLRIELGEIEARLMEQPQVREAVVLAVEILGSQQLVAYLVPQQGADPEGLREVLRGSLLTHLPDYMVPSHWVLLDALPLSPNGKLERKALPRPDVSQAQASYVAPQSELEQRIAAVWEEVLKRERVSLADNFFELGGDSIISMQLVSRARQAGIRFTPKQLFQHQTVQALAGVARLEEAAVQIDQQPLNGPAHLLPLQGWFFDTAIPERHHWNQSVLLKTTQPVDAARLDAALQKLVQHHDALRLRFSEAGDGWHAHFATAQVDTSLLWQAPVADLAALQQLAERAQASLELAQGPLLRAVLAHLPTGEQRLLLVVHHLAIDGVSWRILLEDLEQLYRGATLAPRSHSVQTWAALLHDHAREVLPTRELDYWRAQLDGVASALPGARQGVIGLRRDACVVHTRLDATLTRQLLQEAPAAYRTQVNDLLLTALARVLTRWAGTPSAHVQLEGHGREDIFDGIDLTRTVGWFTSLYPLKLTPQADLGCSIKAIKEQLRAVPDKGVGFAALRYLGEPKLRQQLATLPMPRITFNYLGQFDNSFQAQGEGLFLPSGEAAGAEQSPQAPLSSDLSLDGQVYGGEFDMAWTFSAAQFEPSTMQALADEYGAQLRSLVEHCLVPDNQGLTPSDVPLAELDQAALDALPVAAAQLEDLYPLSPMQHGMLFHSLYEPGGGDYLNQMRVDIAGLDPERFAQAWQYACQDQALLRTGFLWEGLPQPLQAVLKRVKVPFDCCELPLHTDPQQALDALAAAELEKGFDLACPPLLRVLLVRTGDDHHHLIYTHHHLLMDGWSNARLLGEVLQRYAGQVPERTAGRYRDYIEWLQRQDQQSSQTFWQQQLAALKQSTLLARALPTRRGELPMGQGELTQAIDAVSTQRLASMAREHKITLNTLAQGAWLLLLQRYTGQACVAFGATVAGRPLELRGIEQQVGLFINTLPVVAEVDLAQPVAQWLQALQAANLASREHEYTPLADIQRLAGQANEGLFDTLLVFENYPVADALREAPAGLEFGEVYNHEQTNFPLALSVSLAQTLTLHYRFAHQAFDEQAIVQINRHMTQLLAALAEAPQACLRDVVMLAADERQQALLGWNATATEYPLDTPVQRLIEAQVQRTPQAEALVFGDVRLSYAELDARANQLAHHLVGQGVGPDVLVGIAAERSIEMVVGLLAVLKAGGAYVPLDPELPAERLAYMFEDSGIELLLTQSHLSLPMPAGLKLLALDQLDLSAYPATNPNITVAPENLAYVIYTSGSTGKPKGAGNRHSALTNRLCWMQQAYGLDGSDTVLQKTPFSFDVSVWEFFWPLMTGARLAVAGPGDHRDPARLVELIQQYQVTTLHFVPSMLQAFLTDAGVSNCTGLKRIVCSGEALPVDAQQQVFAKLPQAGLYNLYGPTEAAIDVTHWTCREEGADTVPIGQPIANLATYVLDSELNPVPTGVIGELYLGGEGLARGYHRRPGLTAERFATSPFGRGERLYRTGDLARQRADGVIEYAGRIDHQVKIRGLRIELGEIEARLMEQPQVREAVVLAVEILGSQQLVAYLVPQQGVDPEGLREVLRGSLLTHLPDYMVPSHWVLLDALPLSPNGKLERKALPRPDVSQAQASYVAPQDDMELDLAAIWQDVLQVDCVGSRDNFFELGGDSIVSIQLVSRARQHGIRFSPKALFEYPTVHALAQVALRDGSVTQVEQGPLTGATPLLPFQQAFFDTAIPERHHWNQSVLLTPVTALQLPVLQQALDVLLLQHDALRLRFSEADGQWQARCAAPGPAASLACVTLDAPDELACHADALQRSLDLGEGPLFKALLANLKDGEQRLLLVAHHLVVDGVSWRILLQDLQLLCQQLSRGQAPGLPARTTSLRQWGEHLKQHARDAQPAVLKHWQGLLDGVDGDLPRDHAVTTAQRHQARTCVSRFDALITRSLLQDAPGSYRTQVNDLLLTALAQVIARWTGRQDVLVQLEGHGREAPDEALDLSRTVGWFTSLFPVRLSVAEQLPATIKQIKQQLRALPGNGLDFAAVRYLGDAPARQALAGLAVPRITFNYLGQFDASFNRADGMFNLAVEGRGDELSAAAPLANWLNIEGGVQGAELSLAWTFSAAMFDETTIAALAADYERTLTALVMHCLQPGVHGVTPSDFPLAGLDQAALDRLALPLPRVEDLFPLSPMQQGMLFHTLYQKAAGDYINQMRLDVDGLDPERFIQAWQAALDSHESLRSAFLWQGELERPLQMVLRGCPLPVRQLDWRGRADLLGELDALAAEDRAQGFALDQAPLLRLMLVRTGDDRHQLIYTCHHILMDGWSVSRLFAEVLQHYAGQPPQRSAGRYRDYIAWLQGRDTQATEAFWKAQLRALESPTRLADAFSVPPATTQGAAQQSLMVELDAGHSGRLQAFARSQQVTVNTLIQAAWLLLLQRYTGHATVCFGATVAGRPVQVRGAMEQIGLFINTLPVIASPSAQTGVGEFLRGLQASNLDLREHEHTPLYEVQRWAGQGAQALFDSLLVFENYPVSAALAQAGSQGPRFTLLANHEQTNYPLVLALNLGQTLHMQYSHDPRLFDSATVEQLNRHLLHLLAQLCEDGTRALGELALLPAGEREQLLQRWAPCAPDLPLVHERIAQWAERTPDAIALHAADGSVTYAELDARANALAHALVARGIKAEDRVGVAMPRGAGLIVCLLAVHKAGAAYVPLDPEYPAQRLAYLMADSSMVLLLCDSRLEGLPIPQGLALLHPDHLDLAAQPQGLPAVTVRAGQLAYIIYTSGSTGQPKGVAVEHGPLAMHCQAIGERYEMTAEDCELHFMSFAFDGAHERWLTSLTHGGSLLIRDDSLWTPQKTYEQMHRFGVTVAAFPPLYLLQLAEHAERDGNPPPVRVYCFGGDAVPNASFELARRALRPRFIINGYGPTETVVTPLIWKAGREACCGAAYAPIGTRIGERSAQVLDSDLDLLPVGVPGELYLGGSGVARGYLDRPGLTAERFVPDPFGCGARVYRSGDLVRQRADGVVDYLGRIDHQVKIRGFRIELGEVEASLQGLAGVREAVVVARDGGNGPQLVGYLLSEDPAAAHPGPLQQQQRDAIRVALKRQLPGYMVPSQFVFLERFPLTPNGKLDRKALPAPDSPQAGESYVAAQTELQQIVAAVWREVLKLERVGLGDNFFELGGHSLLATQATAQLQLALGGEVALELLFATGSLAEYAEAVANTLTTHSEDDLSEMFDFMAELEAD
ncbi:non-ribosomal peptide synthase/polyketide synthase [Pseudomonas sp. SWRI107]|uniref:non-ribosomal peptide synthase/polyketide synthase n=1 Tax=Pseudomonas farsensis TaxID=2745492 RepID=UPI001C3CF7FB|nr:non-ribosomal peptide synthase/polyketide synthase [Pseudomonas farsensis]MBV4533890.1 non-ribosomal peptide synthase/polyketide synthase [Pseudomonas farsensis]